jgi:hypothetical protein
VIANGRTTRNHLIVELCCAVLGVVSARVTTKCTTDRVVELASRLIASRGRRTVRFESNNVLDGRRVGVVAGN